MEKKAPTLRRALGRWDLTAVGVNQVIGGSIFLLPSQVAVVLGAWSAIAIGLMALVSLSVALNPYSTGITYQWRRGDADN